MNDEICVCGHSKGYHVAGRLDKHGEFCDKEGCFCQRYTWKSFVDYVEVKK